MRHTCLAHSFIPQNVHYAHCPTNKGSSGLVCFHKLSYTTLISSFSSVHIYQGYWKSLTGLVAMAGWAALNWLVRIAWILNQQILKKNKRISITQCTGKFVFSEFRSQRILWRPQSLCTIRCAKYMAILSRPRQCSALALDMSLASSIQFKNHHV